MRTTTTGWMIAAATAALLGGALPAGAEEGVAFKNIMGQIGIIPREKDPIAYRERAPLVVPPKMALPAPSDRESYASANPQWPNDPDLAAKRKRSEEERRPVTWSETRRASERNPLLSQRELQAGRSATSQASVPGTHRGDNARDLLLANPDGRRAAENSVPVVAGEPIRQALTEPPTGIRRASGRNTSGDFTPKVDQQTVDANPINWLTSRFRGNDDDE